MPLDSFIRDINTAIAGQLPKAKVFGIAQPVIRRMGTEFQVLPGLVAPSGEVTYVGIDDTDPIRIYHKLNGIQVAPMTTNRGTGDGVSDTRNTHQLSLYVYQDLRRYSLPTAELFALIQAAMPDQLKTPPYKSVFVRLTNVILNTEQIFAAEYRGVSFKLPAEAVLFQINYTIESAFLKGCFEKCPEVC